MSPALSRVTGMPGRDPPSSSASRVTDSSCEPARAATSTCAVNASLSPSHAATSAALEAKSRVANRRFIVRPSDPGGDQLSAIGYQLSRTRGTAAPREARAGLQVYMVLALT